MTTSTQILIADDDCEMIQILIDAVKPNLNQSGIVYASTPIECRRLTSTRKFDLVFLDIHFGANQEKGTDLIPAILASG